MKSLSMLAAAILLAAVASLSTFAQGGARPAGPAAPAPVSGPVPAAKIAIINTDAFYDEKIGIARLLNALRSVDREFQPKTAEIKQLAADIQKLEEELRQLANNPVADQTASDQKRELYDQKQKDYKRKTEDIQAAGQKRLSEVQAPIIGDILKSLEAWAKQRGITLTLDGTKIANAILAMEPGVDITEQFMKDYNTTHPVTAAMAQPQ